MLKYIAAVCLTASSLLSANGLAAEPVNHAAILAPFVNQDSFGVAYADIAALDLPKDRGGDFNSAIAARHAKLAVGRSSPNLSRRRGRDTRGAIP